VVCDDGIGCTDDSCDEVNDTCASAANDANCPDDGQFCTGTEFCDPVNDCSSTGDSCQAGETCDETNDICFSCAYYTTRGTCNEDPTCEWSGSPKSGTCQNAVVCVPDETPEVTCTDGIDNDCDGMTDCADTADCGGDPACQGGSCDTYTDKTSCQSNGCTWSNKNRVCM
jgi:hypothetical protein